MLMSYGTAASNLIRPFSHHEGARPLAKADLEDWNFKRRGDRCAQQCTGGFLEVTITTPGFPLSSAVSC